MDLFALRKCLFVAFLAIFRQSLTKPAQLCKECGFNAKLVHGLYNTAQVMTENFTEHFINLCRVRFTSKAFTELAFNHAEGSLMRLRIKVAVSQKVFPFQGYMQGHSVNAF